MWQLKLPHKANRHFLNKSASFAPPLQSSSGITGRAGGVSSLGPARIHSSFGVSSETSRDNEPDSLRLHWKPKKERGGGFHLSRKVKEEEEELNAGFPMQLDRGLWYLSVCGHRRVNRSPEGFKFWHILRRTGAQVYVCVVLSRFIIYQLITHENRHPRREKDVTSGSKRSRSSSSHSRLFLNSVQLAFRGSDTANTERPHSLC